MKIPKCMKLVILSLASLLALQTLATPLTSRDLYSPGDGLITYDPVTGSEWLDVNAASGQSMDQIKSGQFYQQGFTYASQDQIMQLLADAGMPFRYFKTYTSEAEALADPVVQNTLSYYSLTSGEAPGFGGGSPTLYQHAQWGDLYANAQVDGASWYKSWWINYRAYHTTADDAYWEFDINTHAPQLRGILETTPYDGGNYLVRTPDTGPGLLVTTATLIGLLAFVRKERKP